MTVAADDGRALSGTLDGLRERKKQRTRLALIDAALDLFLAKGYEATTIDEIVAAVDVSQRTFFRYFATKEDVVLDTMVQYDQIMMEALAARPSAEKPLTALFGALRVVLRHIAESGPDESARFRKIHQVVETTPALVHAHMARHKEAEKVLADLVARRLGVDPETDLRPQLAVAFYTASARVAFEDCARHEIWDAPTVAARVGENITLAQETLRDLI
ncbi:TetR family transcriptional regulator [Actinomadura rudentiformis]|uniref:TetR family transcriptional regulator n=1 Tax=Actinomadura rudentiformis TaxID=359158 RepID=A0A6H9YN22_9ACTN|nr:TetR family transcriptional regulator [Actinomadura rudentiformis]KAB2347402.1 TetR family transcriptional regulator [Actinomadura rudentiformis]